MLRFPRLQVELLCTASSPSLGGGRVDTICLVSIRSEAYTTGSSKRFMTVCAAKARVGSRVVLYDRMMFRTISWLSDQRKMNLVDEASYKLCPYHISLLLQV